MHSKSRAFADISLVEVPAAQVASGADITAQAVTGSIDPKFQNDLVEQDRAVAAARNAGNGNGATPPVTPVTPNPNAGVSTSVVPATPEELRYYEEFGITPEEQRNLERNG